MNKSKKILQKLLSESKKNNKRIKKTIKNKSSLKKCEIFCKKDYMVEMKKVFKKSSEKYNIPYKLPTKQDDDLTYNTCKKTFCNENCDNYEFNDKQRYTDFKKRIKNGFQNTYSNTKITKLKKRGAISGCVDIVDYDVFHK